MTALNPAIRPARGANRLSLYTGDALNNPPAAPSHSYASEFDNSYTLDSPSEQPTWTKDAGKLTKLYITVFPSNYSGGSGLGGLAPPGKFDQDGYVGDDSHNYAGAGGGNQGLAFGVYVEPKRVSSFRKFMKPKTEMELITMWTFDHGVLDVQRGNGISVRGMLARFLIAADRKSGDTKEFMARTQDALSRSQGEMIERNEIDGDATGMRRLKSIVKMLQADGLVEEWDVEEFMGAVRMVLEEKRREGNLGFAVTTIDYLEHLRNKDMELLKG